MSEEAEDRPPHEDTWALAGPHGEVLAVVEGEYGIRARDPKPFKGEFDVNIRVDDPVRGRLLVKISAADTPAEVIAWQEEVLEAAAASPEVTVQTPRILLTREGRKHIRTDDFLVRVVTWIEGPLMSEGSVGVAEPSLLHSLGQTSAKLTCALSSLRAPEGIDEHDWMIHRGPDVVAHSLTVITDHLGERPRGRLGGHRNTGIARQCATVARIAEDFASAVLPALESLPWAVVHHDLHDANVILNGAGTEVAGVIDFNDAVSAPRISDLAITAAYAMLRQRDPEAAFRAVVAGYCSVLEPSPAEVALVGEMSLMRLCMNWAQWQARALTSSDNEYALARSQHTWPLIAHLAEADVPMRERRQA